jgi:AraC family transcriptional regulator
MDFLERMNKTVDYIEANLTDELSYDEIAKIACCPVNQFNRIFSYVIG